MKQPTTITAAELNASHLGNTVTVSPLPSVTISAPLISVRSHRDDPVVRVGLEGIRGTDNYALWPLDPASEVIVTLASEEQAS